MMGSLSILLMLLIRFPIFAAVPFLEYDPADIPILIASFLFGPVSGLVITTVVSMVQGFTVSSSSGIIGIIMHIFSTGSFVLTAGIFYRCHKTKKGAVIALSLGVLVTTVVMALWNLAITPHFMNVSLSYVITLMPFIILFNLIRAGANALVTILIYKKVSAVIWKEKDKYHSA